MNIETSRRSFAKAAALVGVGALAGGQLTIGSASAASSTPSTSSNAAAAAAQSVRNAPPLAPPDRQPPDLKVPEAVKRKTGWAIVGLGQLALEEILPAFAECRLSQPVALVSGHPDKARKVAETYGIDPAAIYDYETYDRLAQNDRVDAIYIVLPNSMHAEYTIRGLRAGKHVLCEKPMAASVEECERMIAASKEAGKRLMIAYRLHYEPFNRKVMELAEQKIYGAVKTFSSSNCQDVKAPNIRLSRQLAGGPVEDVGVYCINAARYVIREEPVEVVAFAHRPTDDSRFREVPESVAFTLRFPSGALAHCDCSFGAATSRRYVANCERGVIEMDPAFSYTGLRLAVSEGSEQKGDARKSELKLEPVNHFASEMDHFSDCILNNKAPHTPGEEGLADMRVVTAIAESVQTGKPVRIGK